MELIFYFVFGGIAVACAAGVVIARNPVNSAINLVGMVLALAGVYVLLNAHFMAVIQVLVYGGAILVLFLFVIMLLNLSDEELGLPRLNFFKVLGSLLVLFLFAQLATLITSASGQVPGPSTRVDNAAISPEWGGLEAVGRVLLSDYMLPFEIASVLLLVAMIGALLIARKKA